MMKHLTIAFPYYDCPNMLKVHLDYWKWLPYTFSTRVNVVVVDDGSPNYPALDVLRKYGIPSFEFKLFRIHENIPWNHGGAKNLAMQQAYPGWVVLTDADHVMSAENIVNLLETKLDPPFIYKPSRDDMLSHTERTPIGTHTGSFIMTKEMFWKIGGFDESLSRFWNGPGYPFRKASKKHAPWIPLEGVRLFRFGNELVGDANVMEWDRVGSEYDIKTNQVMLKKQKQALNKYKPINPLRFTWTREI